MSVSAGSAKLNRALKALLLRWEETKSAWHDQVGREFEEKHLTELRDQSLTTLREMDKLGQVLQKARQECS